MLKLLNILSSSFETYLIILNEKVRRDDNLLNLNTLITRLKQEEHRMKIQEKQINALHRYIGGRNSREDRKNRDQSKENKNVENKRDDNNISDDETDDFCHRCYINHKLLAYKHYFDKNITCFNDKCKKRDHWFKNCRQEDDDMYQKKKTKENKSNKTLKTFIRHIFLMKVFVNELKASHCNFYILNSEATHHCFDNKALFKNLRAIHKMIKIANGETLNIEVINNIEISLSNDKFLILTKVMYISILMINLIVISRLWHKDFNVLYSTDQSCKICLFSDQLMTNADMINNQWILRTIDFKIINAMTINAATSSATLVREVYIFVFAKLTEDLKIWHRRLIHFSYRNVLVNAKKIIDMKNVIDFISETICESCMTDRSQQKQFCVFMTKIIEFIWKINVDIDIDLLIIFCGNCHFVLLKCDVIEFMWFYLCKSKAEIFKIVKNFKTFIEL